MLRRGIKLAAFGLSLLLFTISLAIATPAYAGTITLYRENGGQGDVTAAYPDRPDRSQKVSPNDDARSAVLNQVLPLTIIKITDDPEGHDDDDYIVIKVKQKTPSNLVLGTLDSGFENEYVKVESHYDNGLDGKVSHIEIQGFDF